MFAQRATFALRVLRGLGFAALGLLVASAPPARANVVTITGSLDANFTDATGSGTFTSIDTSPSGGLDIRDFHGAAPNFEHRAAVEFNLAGGGLSASAVIQSVTFNFQATSVTGNTGRTVGIAGFAGSSSLTLADATATATEIATYDNFALGLGKHSIDLGASGVSLLQSLLTGGKPLDLRLQGTTFGTNTLVDSIEMANSLPQFYSAPSITLTFKPVPEPSSLLLSGLFAIPVAAYGLRRRRRQA